MDKDSYTPEEIKAKFDSLPQDIKALVYSSDMFNVVKDLGSKYQLHIDKLAILEDLVADVLTGFTKPDDFVKALQTDLEIDEARASAIAKDVNDQLFVKIRESMKRLYGQPAAPASAVGSVSAPVVPVPAAPAVAPAPMPQSTPMSALATPPPAPAPKPELHPADMMLSQKTVSAAPAVQPASPTPASAPPASSAAAPAQPKPNDIKPQPYKADPYREPTE